MYITAFHGAFFLGVQIPSESKTAENAAFLHFDFWREKGNNIKSREMLW